MKKRFSKINNNWGVTILELAMAMALSAIVVSVVYMTWNAINKHIAIHNSRASLRAESNRLINSIITTIRNNQVLSFDQNTIKLTNNNFDDTITYTFINNRILKNEDTIPLITPHAAIRNFTIRDMNDGSIPESNTLLLEIDLTTSIRDNDTVHLIQQVNTIKTTNEKFPKELWF